MSLPHQYGGVVDPTSFTSSAEFIGGVEVVVFEVGKGV
jgi:hypothetical protein